MALTGNDRGSGGASGSATSFAFSPASNLTPGSLAVLCFGYDNSGSGGSDPYVSISDNVAGEPVWTSRVNSLNDPGAANAGCTLRIFTRPVSRLTTADTITVSFGATSVPSKAWALSEIVPGVGESVEYNTGATGTGTAANPTITSASITSGNAIVGTCSAAITGTITGDSDVSSGSWSTLSSGTAGNSTSTSNILIAAQRKVVTGTATQTYNITLVAAVGCQAWIEVKPVAIPKPGSALRGRQVQG